MQDQLAAKSQADAATIDAPGNANGLTEAEATQRLAQYGENALLEHHVSVLERLARYFWGPIPWMIEVAAILSAAIRHWEDLAIILLTVKGAPLARDHARVLRAHRQGAAKAALAA